MSTPWLKLFPSDWRADPALRMCSMAARGLWMEMLCVMHEAEPRGTLRVNGKPLTSRQLATLAGCPNVDELLAELEEAGVFSREEDGTIFSRRMVRDAEKAEADKANGRKGGNPKLKALDNPTTDEGVNPPDKAQKPDSRSQTPEDPPVAPQGGRADDLFDQVVSAFPRSAHFNAAKAERAFRRLQVEDQAALLEAARRYAAWFAEEQARRKRSAAEAMSFVPPLDKWIGGGAWRNAGGLQLNSQTSDGQEMAVIDSCDPIVARLEALRGKPFIVGTSGKITVLKSELAEARRQA